MTRKSLPEEIADELIKLGLMPLAANLEHARARIIDDIKRIIDRHAKRNAPKKDPKLADLLRQYDAAKRRAWYHSRVPTEVEGKRAKYPSELRYQGAMKICRVLEAQIETLTGEAPRPFNPRA